MRSLLGTPEEWKSMGFHAGLEIHHQIRTHKKLFCHCPADKYYTNWHAEIVRHMRPTLSELGEYDGTALMEFKTRKEIVYRLHRDAVCTYEMDDNPPFPINDEAVDTALIIAQAFQCKIVGELHVIRKQYLDGSIPTGFQRTAIVGVDGVLPLSNGKEIRIVQVGLEEDSCREVSDIGHRIVFMVDRLGIPLIEVVTAPDFETPEECAEGAMRIGRMLRASGLVRRGIGAGRQDVNLSIEGGPRVEIKGVPRIPRIPELLSYEARRQKSLLEIRDESQVRKLAALDNSKSTILERSEKVERPEIAATLAAGDTVRVVKLENARGLIDHILAGYHTFTDELSGRVRVVACLDQTPNVLHTDGDSGRLSADDRDLFRKTAGCSADDVAVVVWGPDRDTITAAAEIIDRWNEALEGIPRETRQALRDNTTDFERILPGPDRMYPDTDSPPYEITEERIEAAAENAPEAPWVREILYRELGIPDDMSFRLAISPHATVFADVVDRTDINPVRAAEVLTSFRVAAMRDGARFDNFNLTHWIEILEAVATGKLHREVLPEFLHIRAADVQTGINKLLESYFLTPASNEEVERTVVKAVSFAKKIRPDKPEVQPHIAMGKAMEVLAGRAPGKQVFQKVSGLVG